MCHVTGSMLSKKWNVFSGTHEGRKRKGPADKQLIFRFQWAEQWTHPVPQELLSKLAPEIRLSAQGGTQAFP